MSSPNPPSQQTSDDSFSNPSVVAHVISLLAQNPLPSSTSEKNVKFLTAVRQLSQSGTSLSSIFSQASYALQLLSETVGSIPPPPRSPEPILSVPPLGPYAVPSVTNFPAPSWSPASPTSLSLPSLGQHFVPSISDLPLQTPWEEKVSGTEFDPWDDCNSQSCTAQWMQLAQPALLIGPSWKLLYSSEPSASSFPMSTKMTTCCKEF